MSADNLRQSVGYKDSSLASSVLSLSCLCSSLEVQAKSKQKPPVHESFASNRAKREHDSPRLPSTSKLFRNV